MQIGNAFGLWINDGAARIALPLCRQWVHGESKVGPNGRLSRPSRRISEIPMS